MAANHSTVPMVRGYFDLPHSSNAFPHKSPLYVAITNHHMRT